jgi:isopropylmalate/homocitrate/citramalate synthase
MAAAEVMNLDLQNNRAVIGKNSFRHVSGISISGYVKSPLAAQPVEAESLGRSSSIVLGKTSGRAAVDHILTSMGIDTSALDMESLVELVKETAEDRRRILSTADLLRLLDAAPTH